MRIRDFFAQYWLRAKVALEGATQRLEDFLAADARGLRAILRKRNARYWITAILVLIVSIIATPWTMDHLGLTPARDAIYQYLGALHWPADKPRNVKVVLIYDDDYWNLGGPIPLDRHYLANLIRKLDADNVGLIALDADLMVPRFEKSLAVGDYADLAKDKTQDRAAVDDLMNAVATAADHRPVILAANVSQTEEQVDAPVGYPYRLGSASYQPYGICKKLRSNGRWDNPGNPPRFSLSEQAKKNISCGYIDLPDDIREMPGLQDIQQGPSIDSFSLAIVRAWTKDDRNADDIGTGTSYITYIPLTVLANSDAIVSAHDVLNGTTRDLAFKPVIIGGAWDYPHGGAPVDMHDTPVNEISGALVHENYAEAALAGRIGWPVPDWLVHILEGLFGVCAMLLFAVYGQVWVKLLMLLGLGIVLLVIQWIMLHLLGVFFEAFVPLLGLAVHSILERQFE